VSARSFSVALSVSVGIVGAVFVAAGCKGELEGDVPPRDHPTDVGPQEEPVGEGLGDNPDGTIRRVETRNPFGGPPENLLTDGDFELSIVPGPSDTQGAWFAVDAFGINPVPLRAETGGLCRTGLRCAVLEPKRLLLGWGTAAGSGIGHEVTIWVKPEGEGTTCDVMDAFTISCFNFDVTSILSADESPDPSGWCRYSGDVPPTNEGVCLYLESNLDAGQTALLDSATLLPGSGAGLQARSSVAPSHAVRERLTKVQKLLRDTRQLARPRPAFGSPLP
jgi:hypothetical protein